MLGPREETTEGFEAQMERCWLNLFAVIEAAGGIATDWRGGPAHMGGRALAAANTDLHAAALAILQHVPQP